MSRRTARFGALPESLFLAERLILAIIEIILGFVSKAEIGGAEETRFWLGRWPQT